MERNGMYDVEIGEQIKVALLTSMVTGDLQDHISRWTDAKMTLDDTRDPIMSLARNRAMMAKPPPIEVNRLCNKEWQVEHWDEEE